MPHKQAVGPAASNHLVTQFWKTEAIQSTNLVLLAQAMLCCGESCAAYLCRDTSCILLSQIHYSNCTLIVSLVTVGQ